MPPSPPSRTERSPAPAAVAELARARFGLGRRQLALLLGFAATAAAAQAWMSARGFTLLEPYSNEERATTLYAYLTLPRQVDVLLIGSSRVREGVDSRIVGATLGEVLGRGVDVYKLGMDGLRPWQLYRMLRGGLAARPPRELLVIGLETRYFARPVSSRTTGEVERGEELVIPGEWQRDEVTDLLAEGFRGLEALWSLPWTRERRTQRARRILQANGGEEWTADQRAKRERQRATRKAEPGRGLELEFELPDDIAFAWSAAESPDQVGMRRSLDLLEALPCRVIFVRMPIQPDFDRERMPVVSRRLLEEVVPSIEARGFDVHDLNRSPFPQTPELFRNPTHMNLAGCQRTSELLAESVLAPYLQPRR